MNSLLRRMTTVFLSVTGVVSLASHCDAAGGKVVSRTAGSSTSYLYALSGSGEDRWISEYPNGTYRPGAIICGGRILMTSIGSVPPPALVVGEVRLEDPTARGYPDLSAAGLVAAADPESLQDCNGSGFRTFTFGRGAGVPDPGATHFVCAIEPLHGTGTYDWCAIHLEVNGAPLGFAKYYEAGVFGSIPWNHWLELIVFEPPPLELDVRPHGSPRFPGDGGRPVLFTTRPNASGAISDDRLSLTIVIDNPTDRPLSRNLEICADVSVLNPKRGLRPVTRAFVRVGEGSPLSNPLTVPPGRTILRLESPYVGVSSRLARLASRAAVNLPFRALADDPSTDLDRCLLDGVLDVAQGTRLLGLRRRAGSPDDNTVDRWFVVQQPNMSGDSLNVRIPALDLPRTVTFVASGFEVVGGEFGGSGLPGLDAIELRTEDPVFTGSPDLTATGLLRSFGTADGVGEAPLSGDPGSAHAFDFNDLAIDPTGPIGLASDLFVLGQLLPGEWSPVTAIAADGWPGDTLLRDSSFTVSGVQPATHDPEWNYMLRLLLDGDRSTLGASAPPAGVSPHAFFGRIGEFILIDHETGRRIE